jgi:hypothetical protein
MCEYDPKCSKADDPLAAPLWKRRRDAVFLVRCPPRRHPLAAVFDLPERGRVLVAPAYQMLRSSILVDSRPDHELERPNELHHMHGVVIRVDEYEDDDRESARCWCGTWSYAPRTIDTRIFGEKHGQPYTIADYVATADSEHARQEREARGN